MSEDDNSPEPPPLQPEDDSVLPDVADAGVLEEDDEPDDVAPTPASAPLFLRSLAFLLDWVLASVFLVAVLQWFVLPNHTAEVEAVKAWWDGFVAGYQNLILQSSTGGQVGFSTMMERSRAFSENAVNGFPPNAMSLLGQIFFMQTFFYWAFFFVTEYFAHGAGLGKRIFHLRVANTRDLGAPSFANSLVRSLLKTLFFCSFSLLLALVGIINAHVALFTATRRTWHDMLSHTIVLDANTSPLPEESEENGGAGGKAGEP